MIGQDKDDTKVFMWIGKQMVLSLIEKDLRYIPYFLKNRMQDVIILVIGNETLLCLLVREYRQAFFETTFIRYMSLKLPAYCVLSRKLKVGVWGERQQ